MRRALVRAGANEVLTYSFVHGDILMRAGQKPEGSYQIINALSPELQYYRQTLTPSLLGAVYSNAKQGFDTFALFEVNKVHPKQHGMTDEGVPSEVDMVAVTVTSKKPQAGAPYYQAKRMLQYLGDSLKLDLMYSPIDADPNYAVTAPFEHRRSAMVTDKKTDTFIGIVGEYKKSVTHGFKLPDYTAGFEIDSSALLNAIQKLTSSYIPLSRYPSTERDICFQVESDVRYMEVIESARSALADTQIETTIVPVDIYQSIDTKDKKNITIRIKLTAHDRTLSGEEASAVVDAVVARVSNVTNAVVI